jgi:hypothetical protein
MTLPFRSRSKARAMSLTPALRGQAIDPQGIRGSLKDERHLQRADGADQMTCERQKEGLRAKGVKVSTRLLSRRSMRTADVRIRRHGAAAFTCARGKFDVSISPFAQWTSGFHAKRSFIATIDHLTHEIRISRRSAEKPSRTLRLRGNGVRRLDCRYKTVSAYALHARRAALQKVTANMNESLASQCIIRILHCAPTMHSPFCRPSDAQRVYKPTDAACMGRRASMRLGIHSLAYSIKTREPRCRPIPASRSH